MFKRQFLAREMNRKSDKIVEYLRRHETEISPFLLAHSFTMFFYRSPFSSPTHAMSREDILLLVLPCVEISLQGNSLIDVQINESMIARQRHRTTPKTSRTILSFHHDSSFPFRHIYIMDPRYMRSEEKRDDENEFSSLSFVGRLFSCVLVAENVTVLVSTLFFSPTNSVF